MVTHPKRVLEFVDADGIIPFRRWLENLKDRKARAIIDARLTRLRLGNLGCCRSVGNGEMELKIDHGPAYRVYFGQNGTDVILLLIGGTKTSHKSDINRSKLFWRIYKRL